MLTGLTGCARQRQAEPDANPAAAPAFNKITDQGIEDSRMAARVREALAAGADYKYDGVKVVARGGVVQLSGYVRTRAQKNRAGEAASRIVGVKSVANELLVKD